MNPTHSGDTCSDKIDSSLPAACHVVILGASNVAMSLPRLVFGLHESIDKNGSLDLFIACGHGRSYGKKSSLLCRKLPGILESGIWSAIEQIQHTQTRQVPSGTFAAPLKVLITDVGNDLIYGVSVEQIGLWVESCLEKLTKGPAEIVMTGLPLESLSRLSSFRYSATQRLFFPANSSRHQEMVGEATRLDQHLRKLAEKSGATFQPQPGGWFGFDPIHFRLSQRSQIWKGLCSHWKGFDVEQSRWTGRPFSFRETRAWKPALRWWCGVSQSTPQPCFSKEKLFVHLF